MSNAKTICAALSILMAGCTNGSQEAAEGAGAAATARAAIVLEAGRSHDFTSADEEGTIQFTVRSGYGLDVAEVLAKRLRYVDQRGTSIEPTVEFTGTKEDPLSIVTARASRPLPVATWVTVRVETDAALSVISAAGSDASAWSLRLFTASDPQLVAIRVSGGQVEMIMSEPVDWQQFRPDLSIDGRRIELCVASERGECTAEERGLMLGESLAFKASAGLPSAGKLDVRFPLLDSARRSRMKTGVELGNLRTIKSGARSWVRALGV
jgi:hypothetical protein